MTPVSAALIVKDEEQTIEPCIEALRPWVDEVVVLDTGSTDRTLEVLGAIAAMPGTPIRVESAEWPGHWGEARTMAQELVTHDWVLMPDADEELVGGKYLGAAIATADERGATVVLLPWRGMRSGLHGVAEDVVACSHKFFRRSGGRWQGSIHERWLLDDPDAVGCSAPPGLYLRAHRLQKAHEYEPAMVAALDDPDTPQAAYMLGVHYAAFGRYAEAIPLLERYLEQPDEPALWRLSAQTHLAFAKESHAHHDDHDDHDLVR